MKESVQLFLNGDLLERYLMGDTHFEEDLQVEHFIETYPEVRQEYDLMQDNLEHYARSYAVPMPEATKKEILEAITAQEKEAPATRSLPFYFVAAMIGAMVFAAATVMLWNQNRLLSTENNAVVNQMEELKNVILETNSKMELLKSKYALSSDPDTKKYVFVGNDKAKDLRSVAYINPRDGLSAVNVVSLPDLPEEKEFKMWAEVDGKMVCIGTLEKADRRLLSLPYADKASGYKITIGNKGNEDFTAIDSEVARIEFEKELP